MGVFDKRGGDKGAPGAAAIGPVAVAVVGVLAYQVLKNKGRVADGLTAPGGLAALFGGGVLTGGLKDLLERFTQAGQQNTAQSWVSTGANEAITAAELEKALGDERIDWLVGQTGLARDEMLAKLAGELPAAVNELTPNGELPTEVEVMQRLDIPR